MLRFRRPHTRLFGLDRRGNIMIEFALVMPILFLLLVGMLDLGRFGLQKSAMLQGARAGGQYALVAYNESANINSTAQNATGLTGVTATNTVFCECVSGTAVSCSTTCGSGQTLKRYVTVTTNKAFSSVLSVSTLSFAGMGSWSPPTSITASVTLIVP
ncbi:MAG: pilus assembly protein [Reyranella sp.]|nr:pilus assembly protein [Reyranella sp.]